MAGTAGHFFEGVVENGSGAGRRFTALDWFQRAIRETFGWLPVPGTLNLRLVESGDCGTAAPGGRVATEFADRILGRGSVLVPPESRWRPAMLLPVRVSGGSEAAGVEAVAVRPLVAGYAADLVEVVASCHLRDTLGLCDSSLVRLEPLAWEMPPVVSTSGRAEGHAALDVQLATGTVTLEANWRSTPSGLMVGLFGGQEHVGAVAMAIPRPSLADPSKRSSTSSVLTVVGHKDDVLARAAAEELARLLDEVVVVAAGVHVGPPGVYNLRPPDAERLLAASLELTRRITEICGANVTS